ncbi:MAG: hypothetical protein ACP5ML_02470 [Fervidicoccus sp.]
MKCSIVKGVIILTQLFQKAWWQLPALPISVDKSGRDRSVRNIAISMLKFHEVVCFAANFVLLAIAAQRPNILIVYRNLGICHLMPIFIKSLNFINTRCRFLLIF